MRIFTDDSPDWRRLGWPGQPVYLALQRRLDRAGLFRVGDLEPADALAAALPGWPPATVAEGLAALVALGWVVWVTGERVLFDPEHLEAQTAPRSSAARSRRRRATSTALAAARQMGLLEEPGDDTKRFVSAATQNVSSQNVSPTTRGVSPPTRNVSLGDPPSREESPEEEEGAETSSAPSRAAPLSGPQLLVAELAAVFREVGAEPPPPSVLGFWRKRAAAVVGGEAAAGWLAAFLRTLAGKGKLTGTEDPQAYVFRALQGRLAEVGQEQAARNGDHRRELLRRQVDLVRAALYDPAEAAAARLELAELAGRCGLTALEPSEGVLADLEAALYGTGGETGASPPAARGAR